VREIVTEQVPDGERDQRAAIRRRCEQRERNEQGRQRRDERFRAPRFDPRPAGIARQRSLLQGPTWIGAPGSSAPRGTE